MSREEGTAYWRGGSSVEKIDNHTEDGSRPVAHGRMVPTTSRRPEACTPPPDAAICRRVDAAEADSSHGPSRARCAARETRRGPGCAHGRAAGAWAMGSTQGPERETLTGRSGPYDPSVLRDLLWAPSRMQAFPMGV